MEDGLRWAATHGLRYVDFRLDTGAEAFDAFTPKRCAALRTQAEAAGITIGLHTLSAVNIAEYAPYLAEAADQGKIGSATRSSTYMSGKVEPPFWFKNSVTSVQFAGTANVPESWTQVPEGPFTRPR